MASNPLQLVDLDNRVLHSVAAPVVVFDDELKNTVVQMKDLIFSEGGIGLAAPQLGVNQRIIVLLNLKTNEPKVVINPQVLQAQGWAWHTEGCLSVPGQLVRKMRSQWVKVGGYTEEGVYEEFERSDLEAACVQHEIDHLNGVLIID